MDMDQGSRAAGAGDDIIAAVATPPGVGGVAVIRLSGPGAQELALGLFRSVRPDFAGFKPYRLHHGDFLGPDGRALDRGLAAFMPGPGSYTGEDVVEFSCHGGRGVSRAVLGAVLQAGARLAGPGEFTLRAFLNGRMDLSQAEAVAELISAPTRAALGWAKAKLDGVLGQRVREVRAALEDLRVRLAVAVDFPEDEVECLSPEELAAGAASALQAVGLLSAGVERAGIWRDGAMAVLAGRVNAGKSSLMNALLGRTRAIVTDQPGTTRDYLEESLDLDGLPVRLVDTAGLRETGDVVELAGLRMGRELMDRADLVVLVADRSVPLGPEELALAQRLGPEGLVVAANKSDLPPARPDPAETLASQGHLVVRVSTRQGQGLEELAGVLRGRLLRGRVEPDPDAPVPNLRQAQALDRAAGELQSLIREAGQGLPYDLLGVRLELACSLLSEVTGEITSQAVLDAVFGQFCIGK